MIKKLQHLTIVTMAIRSKVIPYKDLLVELDIKNVRDLEDLIIESIYAGRLNINFYIFHSRKFINLSAPDFTFISLRVMHTATKIVFELASQVIANSASSVNQNRCCRFRIWPVQTVSSSPLLRI